MMPKEKHLEVINRLHKAIENIDNQLELVENQQEELDLLRMYRKLTKEVWTDVDNFAENLNRKIDEILSS